MAHGDGKHPPNGCITLQFLGKRTSVLTDSLTLKATFHSRASSFAAKKGYLKMQTNANKCSFQATPKLKVDPNCGQTQRQGNTRRKIEEMHPLICTSLRGYTQGYRNTSFGRMPVNLNLGASHCTSIWWALFCLPSWLLVYHRPQEVCNTTLALAKRLHRKIHKIKAINPGDARIA